MIPVQKSCFFKQPIEKALDFIFPPRCPLSGQPVDKQGQVHASVWGQVHFITDPCCWNCGYPFDFSLHTSENFTQNSVDTDLTAICNACLDHEFTFDMARSAFRYKGAGRDLVLLFKHADKTALSTYLAGWMVRCASILLDAGVDVIIPVPLHDFRLLKRRYNQAGLLADAIADHTNIPANHKTLLRTRHTATQGKAHSGNSHLKSKARRTQNVKNAFIVQNPQEIEGKNILLIDDVFTTGATLSECAKTLKNAGAGSVNVLTAARVIKGD